MQKKDLKTVEGLREVMFDAIIPVEQLKKSEKGLLKNLYYWRKNKLLPFFPEKVHFGEIDIPQLIWIRILEILQSFSYTVEKSKKVCEYFFKDAYDHEFAKHTIKNYQLLLEKKKTATTSSYEEEENLEILNGILADENLLYILKFRINYLSELLKKGLDSGEECSILIFLDGTVMEFAEGKYYSHSVERNLQEPHINISLTHLLKEFIHKEEIEKFIVPELLNEQEKIVIKEIRNRKVKELLIKKNDVSIFKIEATQINTISEEQAKSIRELFTMNRYDEIEYKTIDGKSMSCRRTRKYIVR